MKTCRIRTHWSAFAISLALLAGCGSEDGFAFEDGSSDPEQADGEQAEFGQVEEALLASCAGDDSNQLAASLAVAIGKELGRWEVTTDFQVTNGKLELSPTGLLMCGSNCKNVTALLRLQDDASSVVPNHVPSTYRTNLTNWYNGQKTRLTQMVNEMLQVDEGVYQIKFKASGKLLAPQGASITSGALIQQSDQYWGNNTAQWKVLLKGTLRQIINVKSGMCLDLNGSSAVQRACSGTSTQGFRFAQLSAGVLSIRTATNQALEIANSNTANGANLVTGTVEGTAPEQFEFMPYSGGASGVKLLETATAVYALKFKHSGQGLAVSSNSLNDGVSIVQQPYSATDDRFHWYVSNVAQTTWNGAPQLQYQFINRRTGKCMELASSTMGTNLVQRTCSTSTNQYFILTPTGGGHQVAFSIHGWPVGVQNGSTSSGAPIVEANVGWQYYNMMTVEPILAGQPHRLKYSYSTNDGPCGKYDWYNITQPNGMQLAKPADTFVQLIFAGGKTSASGTDLNPYIGQKTSGGQVAIDPSGYMTGGTGSTSGSCLIADIVYDATGGKVNTCCIKYNGIGGVLKTSTWSSTTLLCQ
jgi:hypothetical protein